MRSERKPKKSANVHVEYRLRAENDARALGHAMRRLSRGKWNPALDDTDDANLPASLDGRILRSGVVLRRRGRDKRTTSRQIKINQNNYDF